MLRVFLLTCLSFSVTLPSTLAGPFPLVVLENDQLQTSKKSESSASKFAENADHSERHKVKKGDSLFKIIKIPITLMVWIRGANARARPKIKIPITLLFHLLIILAGWLRTPAST